MATRTKARSLRTRIGEPELGAPRGLYPNLSVALELLRRCRRLMNHLERHTAMSVGLGLADCEILIRAVGARGGTTTMSELALQSGLTQSGLSRVVDRLEVRALVTCRPSAKDRRQTLVVVTDEGTDLARELLDRLEEASRQVLADDAR